MSGYAIEWFVAAFGIGLLGLLACAFRILPDERWQFVATVPLRKHGDGSWIGANFTYYGLLSAIAQVAAFAIVIALAGAVGVGFGAMTALAAVFLVVVLPSARWVARIVEGKQHTFTICGAMFVAVVVLPAAIAAANLLLCAAGAAEMPMLPVLAAIAVAYTFGEGLGRSACISFGCCYGKPVSEMSGFGRRVFKRLHFVFEGDTKKIAYADRLAGVPVVPIQALTAILHVVVGLVCLWLFLRGWFRLALAVSMVSTQLWRVFSESLRADFRGFGAITAYQKMALASAAIALAYALGLTQPPVAAPDVIAGLNLLWSPWPLLLLQTVGIVSFVYSGRSEVTSARVTIDIHHDRI